MSANPKSAARWLTTGVLALAVCGVLLLPDASPAQAQEASLAAPREPRAMRGDGSVTLYWSPVRGAYGYRYQQREADGSRWKESVAIHYNAMRWNWNSRTWQTTIGGLSNDGVDYAFRILATTGYHGAGDVGAPSEIAREGPAGSGSRPLPRPRGTPGKPTDFTVVAGDGTLSLSWQPADDCGGNPCPSSHRYLCVQQGGHCPKTLAEEWQYQIQEAGRPFVNLWHWSGAGHYGSSTTITGLVNGRTYKVQVRPVLRGIYPHRWRYQTLERAGIASDVVTATPTVNYPAVGAPALLGEPKAWRRITVSTDGISDRNGMIQADFEYQWFLVDDGQETLVADHQDDDPGVYWTVPDDVGKRLKVRVSFTDDNGFSETLDSAPSGVIVDAVPLPAYLERGGFHRVTYGRDFFPPAVSEPPPLPWQVETPLVSGRPLRAFSPWDPAYRIRCHPLTNLEVGWYEQSAPTERVGAGGLDRGRRPAAVAWSFWAEGVPAAAGDYRVYAYCKYQDGGRVRFNDPLNLMGRDSKVTLTPEMPMSSPAADGGNDGASGASSGLQSVSVSLSTDSGVDEGSEATVTATLSVALDANVDIPLTLTNGTAEDGDYDALASITITAGQTTGQGKIATTWDADTDADTFTVGLDTDNLPSSVTAGSPSSVSITIEEVPAPDAVSQVTVTHNGDSLSVQ